MAALAFGAWAITTGHSALFGHLTTLAGVISFGLAAAIIAAALIAWAPRRSGPGPAEAAEIQAPPPRPPGPGAFRGQVVGDIPREPPAFQPRADLLAGLDRAAREGAMIHALTGPHGVGKTQLAAAYARARLADGWRLVAWVNAGDATALQAGLAAVAEATGLSEGGAGRDPGDLGRAVRRGLEADGERCLIVFDNAGDPGLLRPFVPTGGTGPARVLITGNGQPAPGLGTGLPVGVFTAEESVAFLTGRTGLPDAAGAAAVAAELGHLPLALALAAAVIAGQYPAYGSYLERLRQLPAQEQVIREREQPYPHGVAEAVLLALGAVQTCDDAAVCTRVMEIISVLSAAGLRPDLLHAAGRIGILADGGHRVEADLVDRALEELARRSLLTFSLDRRTVTAHRLVTRVIRDGLARRKRMTAVCRAAAWTLEARARALAGSPDRAAVRDVLGQITALLDTVTVLDGTAGPTREAAELATVLLRLRILALRHMVALGDNAQQAIAAGEPLAAELDRVRGPDHADTLTSRDNLAAAYRQAGRAAEAIPLLEQVLAARERVLGPDRPDTLASRNNLAAAYRDAGRAAEAIGLFEQVLAARERVLGPDHPGTVTTRDDLAAAYQDGGRGAEAIPLLEQVLAARERVLGPDHPDTLTAQDNLAIARWAAGRVTEAIPVFERALAARERLLGPDHPGTLTSRSNAATAYWAAGRLADAIRLHEQVLAARARVLGPDHPDTLISQNNLAAAYRDAGRAAEAIRLFEQALAARERVLGPDHPGTVTTRNNLAIARSKRAGKPVR